jgi:hypothetical protein
MRPLDQIVDLLLLGVRAAPKQECGDIRAVSLVSRSNINHQQVAFSQPRSRLLRGGAERGRGDDGLQKQCR